MHMRRHAAASEVRGESSKGYYDVDRVASEVSSQNLITNGMSAQGVFFDHFGDVVCKHGGELVIVLHAFDDLAGDNDDAAGHIDCVAPLSGVDDLKAEVNLAWVGIGKSSLVSGNERISDALDAGLHVLVVIRRMLRASMPLKALLRPLWWASSGTAPGS